MSTNGKRRLPSAPHQYIVFLLGVGYVNLWGLFLFHHISKLYFVGRYVTMWGLF